MAKRTKVPKTVTLTPEQRVILIGRAMLYQGAMQKQQTAVWYRRERAQRAMDEAKGVLTDIVIAIGGPGAALAFEKGEPVVTRA